MKTIEVNQSIVGKRCKFLFAGLMLTGTIKEIEVTDCSTKVKVLFDDPHSWNGELYKSSWVSDENGKLLYLEIIDDIYQAIKVTFSTTLYDINRLVTSYYTEWEAANLKEWVDSYESSRFTQIDEHSAIITSEYNMGFIIRWLERNIPIEKIEFLI